MKGSVGVVISDLVEKLNLQVKIGPKERLGRQIEGGYVGDVLSHVMASCKPGYVWITVQTHENVVAVASMLDVASVLVTERDIPDGTLKRAQEEGVVFLWTEKSAFDVAGAIYRLLNP